MNEVVIHATTWLNLKNILRERRQSQKNTYYIDDSIYVKYPGCITL